MGFFKRQEEFNAKKQRDDAASKQAVEAKLNANQPSPMPGVAKASAPTAAPQPVARANAETGTAPAASSVMGQAQVNNPALQKMTWKNTGIVPLAGQGEYRREALRDMNEQEFAKNQAQMNATGKEYWTEQVKKDPTSTYAALQQYFADNETPAEKAKRERREQLGEVFNNLGNLIGNAANLYYTSKGGQNIDLNTANEKHRARMDAIKAKQDALDEQRKNILMNAKLGDITAAKQAAAAKAEREYQAQQSQMERAWKTKHDALMKELDDMYKTGQINAGNKAKLEQMAFKAKSDEDLAKIRGELDRALKRTASYSDILNENKVVESVLGSDGNMYGRRTKLSNQEIRYLADYAENLDAHTSIDEDGKKTIDWVGAANDALESGKVPYEVLEQMGFKKGKTTNPNYKGVESVTWSDENDSNTPPSRRKKSGKDNDNVPPSRRK